MIDEGGNEIGRVRGRIGADTATSATGANIAAYPGDVEYEGYQREGMRHAWTTEPDESGRYHALTLRRQEFDEEAWEVTADQPFPTVDEARDWAARLFAETE
ncbi:MAG TPA: hypothetical protein VFN76_11495 [Candidatus Limnocylindria bacterium]|nr:hypothetical protein [Candidatus Limnocylindria bacterium]